MKVDLDFNKQNTDTLNMDSLFLGLCMQIAQDYDTILRQHVMPEFKNCDGLNLREMRVLRCIAREPFPLTGAEIADRLRYDRATVTRAIKRLDQDGRVVRRQCPHDNRSELLEVTPLGRKLADRYRDQFRSVVNILETMQRDHFTDGDVEQFVKLARKLSKRVNRMSQIKPCEYAPLKQTA